MADTPKPRATRKRRTKAEMEASKAAGPGAADLVKAVEWIDVAQKDDERRPLYERHSIITGGWIIATDGIVTAGHKIDGFDGLYTSPHTGRLLAALTLAGAGLTMSADSAAGTLVIRSDKAHVVVPCQPGGAVPMPAVEMPAYTIDDRFCKALALVLPVTRLAGQTVVEATIYMGATGSVFATDTKIGLEAYHGHATPVMILPRHIGTILKNKEGLTSYGFVNGGITFWFGDKAFIRTTTYDPTTWPNNPLGLFDGFDPNKFHDWPEGLADAIATVSPHNDEDAVFFTGEGVYSDSLPDNAAATYKIKGLPDGYAITGHRLAKAMKIAESKVCWHDRTKLFFGNADLRGVLTTRVSQPTPPPIAETPPDPNNLATLFAGTPGA